MLAVETDTSLIDQGRAECVRIAESGALRVHILVSIAESAAVRIARKWTGNEDWAVRPAVAAEDGMRFDVKFASIRTSN